MTGDFPSKTCRKMEQKNNLVLKNVLNRNLNFFFFKNTFKTWFLLMYFKHFLGLLSDEWPFMVVFFSCPPWQRKKKKRLSVSGFSNQSIYLCILVAVNFSSALARDAKTLLLSETHAMQTSPFNRNFWGYQRGGKEIFVADQSNFFKMFGVLCYIS